MASEELKSLIATLPRLVNASIADSTGSKYSLACDQWEKFCEDKPEIVSRPADPFYIAVYFNYLLNEKGTRGSVTDAMYGIRWGHTSTGFYSPTDHPFVKAAYEGARRLSNYTGTNKKEPVTPSMLHQLIDTYGEQDNLLQQRTLIICLLGFSTFMRLDELLDVKVGDIKFLSLVHDNSCTKSQKRSVKGRKCDIRVGVTITVLSGIEYGGIHNRR